MGQMLHALLRDASFPVAAGLSTPSGEAITSAARGARAGRLVLGGPGDRGGGGRCRWGEETDVGSRGAANIGSRATAA